MHMGGLIQRTFTEVSLKVILFFKNSGIGETKIKVRSADYKGDNTLATFSIKNWLSSSREKLEQQIKLFPGILISDLSIAQEFKWCNLNNQ